ncbi:MAG: hypothetical protein EOO24_24060, partial [Comamonadaceae bacterium]
MVERLAPVSRRADEDLQLLAGLGLADVLIQQLRAQRPLDRLLVGRSRRGRHHAGRRGEVVGLDGHGGRGWIGEFSRHAPPHRCAPPRRPPCLVTIRTGRSRLRHAGALTLSDLSKDRLTLLRTSTEHPLRTHDGELLSYRHRTASSTGRRGVLVLIDGPFEAGIRAGPLADELDLPDFDILAWAPRAEARFPGSSRSALTRHARDLQTLVDHLDKAHGMAVAELHLVAQGAAAVLAASWVHDHAPKVRGLSLVAPRFGAGPGSPARLVLSLAHRLRSKPAPGRSDAPARTQAPMAGAGRDGEAPIAPRPSPACLLDLYRTADRVAADAGSITTPVQLLIAGGDRIADRVAQRRFFDALGSSFKQTLLLADTPHDAFGARDRGAVVQAVRAFALLLAERCADPMATREAPTGALSADPAQPLADASPPLSARNLRRHATSGLVKLGARVSHGLELGRRTGIASAAALDHVYRNHAEGSGALGRRIDRAFLDSIAARALRQRKLHIEELLRDAMERLAGRHRDVRILDIAAGHGRCVLDAVAASPVKVGAILLRDIDEAAAAAGRALMAQRELTGIARYEIADAFDRTGLARTFRRPPPRSASGTCGPGR